MGASDFSVYTAFKARDGMSPVFSKMTRKTGDFETKVKLGMAKAKASMMAFKTVAIATTAAIIGIGTACYVPLKAFADWQKGILSVYTLMNKGEISKYGNEIKNISKNAIRMGYSVEDANKGLFDTVSALGASKKSMDTYNMSMKLAKGGCTDLSIAIDGMTSVINAYGRDTTDVNAVANAFFTAQKYGKTTVEELSTNVGKVAPVAKSAGVSFQELLSAMAALTLGGLSTDEASTALRGALSALVKPSKEAGETLKKLGIPFGVLQIRQKGLTYTLQKLNEASEKHPELMAKAIPNIRAYTAVMALSEDKLKLMDTTINAIANDTKNGTGLGEAFKSMGTSGAATMAKVMGELQVSLIELGDVIAPYLLPLVKSFGNLVHVLGEMSPKIKPIFDGFISLGLAIKNTYIHIVDFCKALKPLVVFLPVVVGLLAGFTFYKVVQGFQMMQVQAALFSMELKTNLIPQLLASLPAIWAQTTALLANPLFWIPAVIATVVTATVLLWKNWDRVTAGFVSFRNAVTPILSNFWVQCKTVFGAVGAFIKNHFTDVLLFALGPVGMILSGVRNIASAIGGLNKKGGIELKTSGVNPAKGTKIKTNPQRGQIGVDVNLTNKTDKNAKVKTNLKSSNNLNLKGK